MFLQPEAEFDSLSIHEPTPEEKEEAELLKNKGNLLYYTCHSLQIKTYYITHVILYR